MTRPDEEGEHAPIDLVAARENMLMGLQAHGVRDERVLTAMAEVPREAFVPEELAAFAYVDAPLPIGEGQTISQPLMVASMVEALHLARDHVVLEVGGGSGYAAAVMSRLARRVFAIERLESLATRAREVLARLGYDNVEVLCGDGTLGWPERAPFDRIIVAAAAPSVPEPLKEQLADRGHLVIPVGSPLMQTLKRVTRTSHDKWEEEDLELVRFVPLIGDAGFGEDLRPAREPARAPPGRAVERINAHAEPISDIEHGDIDALIGRIQNARVVLLGEATHGTSEFYRMRARITRELVERAGFTLVALEADWPDARRIDDYVRHRQLRAREEWSAFSRFPTWMWRNEEMLDFVEWARRHNAGAGRDRPVSFLGLDLYSLYSSLDAVLAYLDDVDPEAAAVARERYSCLTPWRSDPARYGQAAITEGFSDCEEEAVSTLQGLLERRMFYLYDDGDRYQDALHNARLVANAERYYRTLYFGEVESWNLRDDHMFETLLLSLHMAGPGSKAVVWQHNSHIGDAAATEMGARGEHNVGHLCRQSFGDDAVRLVGFGTHTGTVAAASSWGGAMEVKRVLPSRPESYERLCHDADPPSFALPLRDDDLRAALPQSALERAIGVIYRPETELYSHYFSASLARQFDEYIWFDETRAVRPLPTERLEAVPDTFPFTL